MPNLKVVGITGSYGKTSTKHYLHRILSEHFSTTMTPGSFNTTLGVIRTVREYLKPYDEVFIVEMGAKQPGDIKEITDLVHPSAAIITAVGEQHLETFKSIENVQKTKFELVDALPADGFAVLNNDFEYVANRKVDNVKAMRYAVSNPKGADYHAEDIKYSSRGTTFKVVGPGLSEPLELHTALVGECNVSNLLGAVIVALKLGVPAEKIKYAVSQIEQVEHRLSVRRIPGGLTIIDDAFNSNPSGSKMAVEVLGMMKDEGKRIIITPGMIELGARQVEANTQFGRYIAANADVAIVVGQYNRDAILAGIKDGKMDEANVYAVDSFKDAQITLHSIARPGDIVLYENDLPDTFK
jgi:UDP-N-acetylmuramoyl-tripeptide--D-alanyl-D-alanine ligase